MAADTKAAKHLDDDSVNDMKKAFAYFDKNSDGKISKEELKDVLKEANVNFNDEQLSEFMRRIDTDGNGSIDFNEFCTIMKDMVLAAIEVERQIRTVFGGMDLNNDSKISADELRIALTKLIEEDVTLDQAHQIIAAVDRDGDKQINYEEFVTMVYMLQIF